MQHEGGMDKVEWLTLGFHEPLDVAVMKLSGERDVTERCLCHRQHLLGEVHADERAQRQRPEYRGHLRHVAAAQITGPAGVGKAMLVRAVCAGRRLVELDGPNVGALAAQDRSERPETVFKALAALSAAGDPEYVLIHDAARPLTPPATTRRVVDALRAGSRAVIPVLPVSDTIKAVDANGAVLGTPERSGLRAVQTPQGFETALLRRAYELATDLAVTDDASLVERMGIAVQTVPGDPMAFKITTPLDLRLARAVLET